jgi:hypothetical protein
MKLELVKEIDIKGQTSYHVKADDSYVIGSTRFDVMEAQQVYDEIKANSTKARTEVLIREEI